jgi:hypothetical protein
METRVSKHQITMVKEGNRHLTIMEIWVFRLLIMVDNKNLVMWVCRHLHIINHILNKTIWVNRHLITMTIEVYRHNHIHSQLSQIIVK